VIQELLLYDCNI